MPSMRLAVAAGGSGHHAVLSLTIVEALERRGVVETVAYLGSIDPTERMVVERAGMAHHPVYARRHRGEFASLLLNNAAPVAAAVPKAARLLRELRVTAVLSSGGLPSLPVVFAARLLRLPVFLFVPEVRPPLGFRVQARLAALTATSTEEGARHLPGRPVVTGHPVRREFWEIDRDDARGRFGAAPGERLLLVSVGTAPDRLEQFNDWLWRDAPSLLEQVRILQVTGLREEARFLERRASLPTALQERWLIHGFTWDFPAMLVAADLGVLRCGAAIIGELPAAGLPAILIPRAKSSGRHQEHTARYFAERGCAWMLTEDRVESASSLSAQLLGDEAARAAARDRLVALRRPSAADDVAALFAKHVAG